MSNEKLHADVVKGCIQIVHYIHKNRTQGNISLGDLYKAGTKHLKGEEEDARKLGAGSFILEFIKDGMINWSRQDFDDVLYGDYDKLWRMTNSYLQNFGHPPVEPMPIALD